MEVTPLSPGKVRKQVQNAPKHVRSSLIGATLSHELREKYGIRSIRVRKDDSVKVLRGEYAGVEGKVTKIFTGSGRITIEGVTREKIAGGTVPVKIHSSNVMVTNLNLGDEWRKKKL